MGKRVEWSGPGKSDLRVIDQVIALRILHTLGRYLANGEGDVKPIKNTDPTEFRLRCGDYRVRFCDHGDAILILAVKHRREAYR